MSKRKAYLDYLNLVQRHASNLHPLHGVFELTYKCNLSCRHCYVVRRKQPELNTAQIKGLIRQLKNVGCLYLTLTGGEVFLRDDFFEIAEYARQLNFALRIFTNGTLINSKIIDRLKSLDPTVEISLYGFKNIHDKITRVKGSFDKTINAIKLLKKEKIHVKVKNMVMRQNVAEVFSLKKYLTDKLKVEQGSAFLISGSDDGSTKPLACRLDDGQLRRYLCKSMQEIKTLKREVTVLKKVNLDETLCGMGCATCNITPYGELNPCLQMRLNVLIGKKTLWDVWKNNSQINNARYLRVKDRKACVHCELIQYCLFYCPGMVLVEGKKIEDKFDEACRIAKILKNIAAKSLSVKQ